MRSFLSFALRPLDLAFPFQQKRFQKFPKQKIASFGEAPPAFRVHATF
jgi:hypothetical protein